MGTVSESPCHAACVVDESLDCIFAIYGWLAGVSVAVGWSRSDGHGGNRSGSGTIHSVRWFGVVGVVGLEPFWATNAYVSGISGPSGKGMEGTSTPGGRSGPGGLEGRVGAGDGDVGSACAMPIPSPTALKPRPPDTTAMATSCVSFSAHPAGFSSGPGRSEFAVCLLAISFSHCTGKSSPLSIRSGGNSRAASSTACGTAGRSGSWTRAVTASIRARSATMASTALPRSRINSASAPAGRTRFTPGS
jgi:hypothetical protein